MLSVHVTAQKSVAIVEVPPPVPAPGEALIALKASSVNRGELALIGMRDPGWAPGQDVAGVVVAAAADGSGPAEGSRVVGLAEQGAWSELVVVKASRLAVIPETVSDAQAAALPMAGLTALRTVRLLGSLLGREVLVTGASGGVGRFQMQLAALSGARVTAFTRTEDELSGAYAVVADLDGAGPYDAALDGIGGTILADTLQTLRPGADLVWFGSTSGPTPLSIYDFIGHEGVTVRTYFSYAADNSRDTRDLDTLLGLAATGALSVDISHCWPLTETAQAVTQLDNGGTRGKIILTNENTDQPERNHS
ncbi:zinc-binding dehydrogenase [Luethyella okanaganae]|uniref:Zinc-binding dehydrogenase n=1 Tax=Luethyella okanaganae TaxID=69372 RepID=A0ABW1VDT2_9MICO